MAVTYPRADLFTAFAIKASRFALNFRQAFSRDGGGRTTTVDFREPYWEGAFVSAVLSEDDCVSLEAALHSLDGMARQFLATDTRRTYPLRMAQGVISGVQITGANAGRNLCNFSGLPANAILSQGDKFSIEANGLHYLFQFVEGAQADNAGVITAAEIRPRVPLSIGFSQSVKLSRPTCSMKIDPASVAFQSSGPLLGTVSFTAAQML
jgi:hypothetical protein